MFKADDILAVLDEAAGNYVFPMLDNGYVYPVAARLSLHRGDSAWGLVIETFGFSPRAGIPDLLVTTFSNAVVHSEPRSSDDFPNAEAWEAHKRMFAHADQRWFWPLQAEGSEWMDDDERLDTTLAHLMVRGTERPLPSPADYAAAGVTLADPPRPYVHEAMRALASLHRDAVLATPEERRIGLPDGLSPLLVLDDWHHPGAADADSLPSRSTTFRQLADILVSGDTAVYRAAEPGNTHWSNWPDGGAL